MLNQEIKDTIALAKSYLINTITYLPERPSRMKVSSQLQQVISLLETVQTQIETEANRTVEEHSTRDAFFDAPSPF